MKRRFALIASVVTLAFAATTFSALAKDKQVTLTGEAKCAKCMLHQGTTCQTVIEVGKKAKTKDYYVVANDVSKAFHEDICHAAKKVTASGTVSKSSGKLEITLSKIAAAK